ncbi:lymphocyte antigen 6D [Ochotona princeps]|uniref:lymphocyte antigen 6D n=1 Tax=Ochotona princeps TaxID=9978 RepID=UPI002714903E|nr:lymphocyte antigen 6D [Ochotona princeps]
MTMNTVEPLSGNLVTKACTDYCTPSRNMQGQVSKGTAATYCCQSDLCNESASSAAPRHAPLAGTLLSLVLAAGLLACAWTPGL